MKVYQGWILNFYKRVYARQQLDLNDTNCFFTLGYYDWMTASPFTGMDDIQQIITKKTIAIEPTEQIVMISPSLQSTFQETEFPSPSVLCFVALDLNSEQSEYSCTRQLQDKISEYINQNDYSISAVAYTTMSESAVCLVFSPLNKKHFDKAYFEQIFSVITYLRQSSNFIYTYSIIAFSCNRDNESVDKTCKIPILDIHLLAKPSRTDDVASYVNNYLIPALYDKKKETMVGEQKKLLIQIGTNDYLLTLHNVPFYKLCNAYMKNGILSGNDPKGYQNIFDAFYSTIGMILSLEEQSREIDFIDDKANKDDDTFINTEEVFLEKNQRIRGYAEMSKRKLNEFNLNKRNPFIRWTSKLYSDLLDQYTTILNKELTYQETELVLSIDPFSFYDAFDKIIQSLHPNSLYCAHSYGINVAHSMFAPRALVAYTQLLNEIAQEWDSAKINRLRAEPDYLIPQHKFMLYMNHNLRVEAEEYSANLPPDNSVIMIRFPQSMIYNADILMPLLLHETGHFIGVRKRKFVEGAINREKYFINLVAEQLLFLMYCSIKKTFSYATNRYDMIINVPYQCDQDSERLLLEFLRSVVSKVAEKFENMYKAYKEYYLNKLENDKRITSDEKRENKLGINEGYFRYAKRILMLCVERFILDWDKVETEYLDAFFAQKPTIEEVSKENLKIMLQKIISELRNHMSGKMGEVFIDDCASCLSEPVADLFMVKMLDMRAIEYLLLVFEQRMSSDDNQRTIRQKATADTARARYISVLNILSPSVSTTNYKISTSFEKSRLEAIAAAWKMEYSQLEKNYEYFVHIALEELTQLRLLLENSEHSNPTLSAIFDPAYRVSQYISALSSDQRYTEKEIKEKIPIVEKIREFYRAACDAESSNELVSPDNVIENSFCTVFGKLFSFLRWTTPTETDE